MGLALDLEPELCGPVSRDLSNDTVLVSKHSQLVDKMEYYDRLDLMCSGSRGHSVVTWLVTWLVTWPVIVKIRLLNK